MKISIIHTAEDFLLLKKDWDILYAQNDYTVFQSFDYCFHSLEEGMLPFVVISKENNKIREIWPCVINQGKLEFINQKHADFCDILIDSSNSKILQFIIDQKEIKRIALKNIREDSKILRVLGRSEYLLIKNEVSYSTLFLEQTDSFPSNFTQFIYRKRRRLTRILKKYPTGILELLSFPENDFPLKEIQVLRKKMIDLSVRKKDFLDATLLNLIKVLYNSNKLKISILKVDNQISAISFFFQRKDEYSFWIDVFDEKQMINLYHNTLFIKTITEKQTAIFNFGRGNYLYKNQNFSPNFFPLFSINIFRNNYNLRFYQLKLALIIFGKSIFSKIK